MRAWLLAGVLLLAGCGAPSTPTSQETLGPALTPSPDSPYQVWLGQKIIDFGGVLSRASDCASGGNCVPDAQAVVSAAQQLKAEIAAHGTPPPCAATSAQDVQLALDSEVAGYQLYIQAVNKNDTSQLPAVQAKVDAGKRHLSEATASATC